MTGRMTMVACALALAAAAIGQEPARPGDWGGPGGNWGPRQWLNRMIEGLDRELGFDEQQLTQLDGIVAAQEARMQAAFAQWQEVRVAMETGDEARASALREQLRQQFDERREPMADMFDEIETVLHEDQLVTFRDMRQRMRQWQAHGRQMWQAVRELPDAVGMTEEQRGAYRALLRQRWETMQQQMRQRWEQGESGMQWETPDFAALEDEFYGQVAGLLDKDQQRLLGEYRLQFVAEAQPPDAQQPDDLRKVLQAMRRVRGLSSQQRDALREIERKANRSHHEIRSDKQRSAELAAEVKAQIIKVLDKEQAEEFQLNVDRLHGRAGRGDHGARDRDGRAREDRERGDSAQKQVE
jgi:hypothetical protein